jgi:hypothetical protein
MLVAKPSHLVHFDLYLPIADRRREPPIGQWSLPAFFGLWLSHVPRARWSDFWNLVRRCLRPAGQVVVVDQHAVKLLEETSVDAAGDIVPRMLSDGRQFRIVRVPLTPARLTAGPGRDRLGRRSGHAQRPVPRRPSHSALDVMPDPGRPSGVDHGGAAGAVHTEVGGTAWRGMVSTGSSTDCHEAGRRARVRCRG